MIHRLLFAFTYQQERSTDNSRNKKGNRCYYQNCSLIYLSSPSFLLFLAKFKNCLTEITRIIKNAIKKIIAQPTSGIIFVYRPINCISLVRYTLIEI